MKRTNLLRLLAALVIVVVAMAIAGVVAYHLGVTNSPNSPVMRGMPMRGYEGGSAYYGLGAGLFELLGFVLVGVLVFWLLAALLSPNRGGPGSTGPAGGDPERLRELSDMHARGQLTDEEFTAAKRKLLGLQ